MIKRLAVYYFCRVLFFFRVTTSRFVWFVGRVGAWLISLFILSARDPSDLNESRAVSLIAYRWFITAQASWKNSRMQKVDGPRATRLICLLFGSQTWVRERVCIVCIVCIVCGSWREAQKLKSVARVLSAPFSPSFFYSSGFCWFYCVDLRSAMETVRFQPNRFKSGCRLNPDRFIFFSR